MANGDKVVVLYNRHNLLKVDVSITWDLVGWSSSSNVTVRSLWDRKDLGFFIGGFTASKLESHDVVMLRVTLIK